MGFSDVAVQVIMFIAVIVVGAMVVVFFNNYSKETVDTANMQRQELSEKMKTSVTIDVINFVNSTSPDTLNIYVKNTGRSIIDTENIDVYVDKERIPKNATNMTITVIADTDKINTGKFDPKEEVLIKVFRNLVTGKTHTLDIILANGIKDSTEFSN